MSYQNSPRQYERKNYGHNQYHGGGQQDYQPHGNYDNDMRMHHGNGRKYYGYQRSMDQPWIPPVVTQRVTVTEEETNVVETSSKNENDKEETESIIY